MILERCQASSVQCTAVMCFDHHEASSAWLRLSDSTHHRSKEPTVHQTNQGCDTDPEHMTRTASKIHNYS